MFSNSILRVASSGLRHPIAEHLDVIKLLALFDAAGGACRLAIAVSSINSRRSTQLLDLLGLQIQHFLIGLKVLLKCLVLISDIRTAIVFAS